MTFNELRSIKDSLPEGSMHRIADELGMTVETVRTLVWARASAYTLSRVPTEV